MADHVDEFLTVAEVAAILKLNSRRCATGSTRLAARAPRRRRVRIRRSDFDRLIEQGYSGRLQRRPNAPMSRASGTGDPPPEVPLGSAGWAWGWCLRRVTERPAPTVAVRGVVAWRRTRSRRGVRPGVAPLVLGTSPVEAIGSTSAW